MIKEVANNNEEFKERIFKAPNNQLQEDLKFKKFIKMASDTSSSQDITEEILLTEKKKSGKGESRNKEKSKQKTQNSRDDHLKRPFFSQLHLGMLKLFMGCIR